MMENSRKSFKALSLAQPIKKDIDETLNKLQIQKRKFLSFQRQQSALKEQIQKSRRQLNEAKLLQPKIRVKQNKSIQTGMSISNTDRLFLNTVNKISQFRSKIEVHRRQIQKYKKLVSCLNEQIATIQTQNNQLESYLLKKQQENQNVKDHLLEYRTLNMRNTDQFKNSFHALHRSTVKQQNQRIKAQALRKSFNFEEIRHSKLINIVDVEEQSHLNQGENPSKQDIYMTNCIPLIKERVRILIHSNKQKIKISENYKKFGEQLQNMFSIMKQYKGRDDVGFLASQFVMKEKQLKKIEQYIGKLQNRFTSYRNQLVKVKSSDQLLKKQISQDINQQYKTNDQRYVQLQQQVKQSIQTLRVKQIQNSRWFQAIGNILTPLVPDEQVNRGNIDKILGTIQQAYLRQQVKEQNYQHKLANKSAGKISVLPIIEDKQIKMAQPMELMSYKKLKEYAKEYIVNKR